MNPYTFLVETYATERLKTLSVWMQFDVGDLGFRPEPRARTPLEHMVHQCASEEAWMERMLGIHTGLPPLPREETRLGFLEHYALASERRLAALNAKPGDWYGEMTRFFDVPRSRAWVLTRRIAHSAHHRGQLTIYLRLLGRDLFSTYGPTADTGGLAPQGASVIYLYRTVEDLLLAARGGAVQAPKLPGTGPAPPTERPG